MRNLCNWSPLFLLALTNFSVYALLGPQEKSGSKPRIPISPYYFVFPEISEKPRGFTTNEDRKRVRILIRSFAEIEHPDFGFSATLSGQNFAAIDGNARFGGGLITDHQLKTNAAFKELVTLGPKALPQLLVSLGDTTPTKFVVNHETSMFTAMWHARELENNPANPYEHQKLAAGSDPPDLSTEVYVEEYTLKVGDVCFVALGQIVGRNYSAIRYQPSACIVIKSTASDREFRELIRSIWRHEDPHKFLFDSLLHDYSTRAPFKERAWSRASEFQCGAAKRLLFYFPDTASAFIAERIKKLKIDWIKPSASARSQRLANERARKQAQENEVDSTDLIAAVAWSKDSRVSEVLEEIENKVVEPELAEILAGRRGKR